MQIETQFKKSSFYLNHSCNRISLYSAQLFSIKHGMVEIAVKTFEEF